MSTDTTDGQDVDGSYSRHTEHPDQGGKRYVRCEECGAELLESLGGTDRLVHRRDCSTGAGR